MAKDTVTKETASSKTDEKQEAVVNPTGAKRIKQESAYSVKELVANAGKLFNTMPECAAAALRAANKENITVSEAQEIVSKFLKKEVK